jgi:hypothetical protein
MSTHPLHSRYRCRLTEEQAARLEAAPDNTAEWTIVEMLNDAADHIDSLVGDKRVLAGEVRSLTERNARLLRAIEHETTP